VVRNEVLRMMIAENVYDGTDGIPKRTLSMSCLMSAKEYFFRGGVFVSFLQLNSTQYAHKLIEYSHHTAFNIMRAI